MIKNYIFDIDGTLINTIDMYMPAMIEILEKHGYHTDPADVEQKKHDLFGITGMDALKIAGVAKKVADVDPLRSGQLQDIDPFDNQHVRFFNRLILIRNDIVDAM